MTLFVKPKISTTARSGDGPLSIEVDRQGCFTIAWGDTMIVRDAVLLSVAVGGSVCKPEFVSADVEGDTLRVVGGYGGLQIEHTLKIETRGLGVGVCQESTLTNVGRDEILVSGVDYSLPAFMADGAGPDTRLQVPGQITPPDLSYAEAAELPLDRTASEPIPKFPQGWLDHCPDQGVGLVVVESSRGCVGAWHWDERAAPAFPTLDGHDGVMDVTHRHQITARLGPGETLTSDGHRLLITPGGLEEFLTAFRKWTYAGWEPAACPAWAEDLRILQIDARPIRRWTERLDVIAAMGFNAIYCVPVWENQDDHWYALADHYGLDPKVGTEAELKGFVNEAHRRGLKVLFDFIPQGTGDRSGLLEQHPEWLVRDERGRPFGSHGWGPKPGEPKNGHTYSLDWGREDVQEFMLDWAMWNVETFGIDGFRTDALHWKEPNLNPANDASAWRTFYGGIRIGERLAERLDDDKLLLGELPGPVFGRSHAMTYENAWVLGLLNRTWLDETADLSMKQWRRWQWISERSLPPRLKRVYFSATHDLLKVAAESRKSPVADALAFAHACSGGGYFVCWAELDWAAIDRGEDGRHGTFKTVLRQRARLTGRTCVWDVTTGGEDEYLFVTRWTTPGELDAFALANVSSRPLRATIEGLGDVEVAAGVSEIRLAE